MEILQQFDPSQNNGQHVPLKIMLLQSLGAKKWLNVLVLNLNSKQLIIYFSNFHELIAAIAHKLGVAYSTIKKAHVYFLIPYLSLLQKFFRHSTDKNKTVLSTHFRIS